MFNLVTTLINTGFKTAVLAGVCIGGFTYYTKPTNESFTKFIIKDVPIGLGWISGAVIDKGVQPEYADYLFFKIVTVRLDKTKTKFIGIVNSWHNIK